MGSMWTESVDAHLEVVRASRDTLASPVEDCVKRCEHSLAQGGKLLVCGNGGSAADAQHFATELVGRFLKDRAAIAALALTTDSSNLTAIANDLGYERIFARQVEALGRSGDVLFAISTSGNSANVLNAVDAARARDMVVIGLTGESGGALAQRCDTVIRAPSDEVPRIQEVHELVLHVVAASLEETFS